MSEFQGTKTCLQMFKPNWSEEVFLIKKKKIPYLGLM